MRKPWSWRKSLVVLAITVAAFMALPVAHAQQIFLPGTVVALEGTPHLWIADDQGVLHWGGDTRALAGRHINWSARAEVSLAGLRALPKGDPWLSAGLLKEGDPIYLVKWETEWPLPRLLHIQSIADVEIFGIDETNYGDFVLDRATWEARYGISVAGLQRAELPPADSSAAPASATPAGPDSADIPYQSIRGYDGGAGTLNLPQGAVTLQLQFGGWGEGPVTVTYETGSGARVALIDNKEVGYYGEIVFDAPQAASYLFRVSASRDWIIWVGLAPGLPSVPKPLNGCRTAVRWHQSGDGVHKARFDCGGVRLDGTSYSEINTDKKHWVVWYRDGKFLAVTATGSTLSAEDVQISYQALSGYGGGAGQLTLPAGQVTINIEYGNWKKAPFTLTLRSPSGEQISVLDAAMIAYRSRLTVNIAEAGSHSVHIGAQRDWRLWVGVDAGGIISRLEDIDVPVDGCSTRKDWKLDKGVYRGEYKCPSFNLRGAFFPGLNTDSKFWVVWSREDKFHEVTSHKT